MEQRVEPARRAAQVVYKKLACCLQSQQGLDVGKRMKKLPQMLLSVSMAESLKDFDGDSSIRKVLEMSCFMQSFLAKTLAGFEVQLEKDVLEPLIKLSEEDLPEILKNKKQFAKLTTDWHNACNRSQTSSGPQAKQDGLREDMEEAWRRLENIKDQYSADLYHFASKEDDYASYFIRLLDLQAEYHKKSFGFLEKNISELRENCIHAGKQVSMLSNSSGKVFGRPLLSHLLDSGEEIAVPIRHCVQMLLDKGMEEEGLFRLAAAASAVKRLKSSLDCGHIDHNEFSSDPHAVAGALKSYLRELPEPLMTFELYSDWLKVAGEKEVSDRLEHLKGVLRKLPQENYNNLQYLMKFLACLSEQEAATKMSPKNIAIVLGPNLLWPRMEGEGSPMEMASQYSMQVVTVIEPLIQYASSLFPEGEDFTTPEALRSPDLSESLLQGLNSWMTSTHGTSLCSFFSVTDSSSVSSVDLAANSDPVASPTTVRQNPPSHSTSQTPTPNQNNDHNKGPTHTFAQSQEASPDQSHLSPTVVTEAQKDERFSWQYGPHLTQQSMEHRNPCPSSPSYTSTSAPSPCSAQPPARRTTLSCVTSQNPSTSRGKKRAMVKAPNVPPPPPPSPSSALLRRPMNPGTLECHLEISYIYMFHESPRQPVFTGTAAPSLAPT
ncbi:hypothetical protein SKAU_G00121650 [Synaphobranchus kaupii]|uniref:SH3-domain binding protein 1 n=1 Tax=Synaphobranchus kaupii TaxID=118154 RepID=A0A9Q1J1H2_SYNKA|nr:hypothetical protein SKAU_G00121650 [Synaphobranchus kaupii]